MIKTIKYFFEAFFLYLFFIVAKLLGLSISRKFFAFFFQKIGPIIRKKDIAEKNLNIFSNHLTDEEKEKIKSNMWSNYGMTFIEYIFLNKFRKEQAHINIKGIKILDEIFKSNKPVIFISGHFANFELMSMELVKKKISLATIYRPLNNFFLNFFMEYVRKTYVCKNQIKKGLVGVKEAINYIKNNTSIALMIDQRVSEGKRLPFFDHMAFTTTLPSQLALKFNLDIVPIYIVRKENDNFEMEIYEPIKIQNKKDSETNKLDISIKLNKILEKMISKNPGQWIWTHNRWKR